MQAPTNDALSFSEIAKLTPIQVYDRPLKELLSELNQKIKDAGIEFGETDFGLMFLSEPENTFPQCRWISVYPVPGENEGIYIHIDAIRQSHHKGPQLMSVAKTWTWESALAISAAASRLLHS